MTDKKTKDENGSKEVFTLLCVKATGNPPMTFNNKKLNGGRK
jgi:hypothetical protein